MYESSDYRNYFNLVSHHDERKTNDMFHRFELKPQQSWPNKKIFLTERCSPSSFSAAFRAKATSQILLKRLSPRTNIWSETFSATSLRCCSVQLTIDLHCCSEKNDQNWIELENFQVLQFNAHEVAQFEMVTKTSQEGAKSAFIGAAVYPTLALFNHRYI